jgi:hypothetical protein
MLVNQVADEGQRRLITDGRPATGVGAQPDVPGGAATPEHLLDNRLADAKEGCHGAR